MANCKKSPEKMIAVIATLLLLSSVILATTQGGNQLAFAQSGNSMMNMSSSSSLPQPNSNGTLLNVEASNGLFEPAAGLSNVFGRKRIVPFYKCVQMCRCPNMWSISRRSG